MVDWDALVERGDAAVAVADRIRQIREECGISQQLPLTEIEGDQILRALERLIEVIDRADAN